MAAGDQVQIVLDDVQAAGVGYTVPAGQAIQPLAVNATIDGSGAASAFLPTLEIVSDSGHIIARCPAPQVAAGGSAEVSWFPHVAAATAAAASAGLSWAFIDVTAATNFPAAAITAIPGHAGGFYTNDSAVFSLQTDATYGVSGIEWASVGHYLAMVEIDFQAIGAAPVDLLMLVLDPLGAQINYIDGQNELTAQTTPYVNPARIMQRRVFSAATAGTPPSTAPLVWGIWNTGANAASLSSGGMLVIQLDAVDSVIA